MNTRCDLCVEQYGASVRSEDVWIKTVNGHDKLVCAFHKGDFKNANIKKQHVGDSANDSLSASL